MKIFKGGDFFIFSYDKQLILKTMSYEDFKTISGMYKDYYNHFKKNPNSLITKIYGIFKFEYNQIVEYLYLMRNIQGS